MVVSSRPRAGQVVEFYEIWAEGEDNFRVLEFNRPDADRAAQRIAEDELITVEVRPIKPGRNA